PAAPVTTMYTIGIPSKLEIERAGVAHHDRDARRKSTQQLVADRSSGRRHVVDGNALAPQDHRTAHARFRDIAEVDREKIHRDAPRQSRHAAAYHDRRSVGRVARIAV